MSVPINQSANLSIKFNNDSTSAQIDTGASYSIIMKDLFNKMLKMKNLIKECKPTQMHAFTANSQDMKFSADETKQRNE